MEKPYKIGCVIPINGRSGLVNKTIARLKRQIDCKVTIICIGAEEDRVNISEEIRNEICQFFIYRNQPLGAKWQFGIDILHNSNPDIDAYLHIGSDDWITDRYCSACMNILSESRGAIGVKGFYVYELETKKMLYWPGYSGDRENEPLGAGRMISRETLELLNWQVHDTMIDSGLDIMIAKNIIKTGKNIECFADDIGIAVLGIKTKSWNSKNNFDTFIKASYPIPSLMVESFIEKNFPGISEIKLPEVEVNNDKML